MLKRRRVINSFYAQHIACTQFECTQCDTAITAGMIYERRVLDAGKRLEVERYHAVPCCPDFYYMGR